MQYGHADASTTSTAPCRQESRRRPTPERRFNDRPITTPERAGCALSCVRSALDDSGLSIRSIATTPSSTPPLHQQFRHQAFHQASPHSSPSSLVHRNIGTAAFSPLLLLKTKARQHPRHDTRDTATRTLSFSRNFGKSPTAHPLPLSAVMCPSPPCMLHTPSSHLACQSRVHRRRRRRPQHRSNSPPHTRPPSPCVPRAPRRRLPLSRSPANLPPTNRPVVSNVSGQASQPASQPPVHRPVDQSASQRVVARRRACRALLYVDEVPDCLPCMCIGRSQHFKALHPV